MTLSPIYRLHVRRFAIASLCFSAAACAPSADGETRPQAGSSPRSATTVATRPAGEGRVYGLGRAASPADIAGFDIDVGPDGAGLPPGQATVQEGLEIYAAKCVVCHGPTGAEGPFDLLTGRLPNDEFPFATDPSVRSTVGNYWPYATTMFDYTRRAMPFDFPGSLTDHEVYAVVGAMLYFNGLVEADAIIDSAAVANVIMPSRDRFVRDDRTGGPEIR